MEIMKSIQASFICNDIQMISLKRARESSVKNFGILEDLGQVSYVFTDKTGTLTNNEMKFKAACIGEKTIEVTESMLGLVDMGEINSYLDGKRDDSEVDLKLTSLYGKETFRISSQRQLIIEYLKVLSLAHEVVTEEDTREGEEIKYEGPSPDEITLVEFARDCGYKFLNGSDKCLYLHLEKRTEISGNESVITMNTA